MATRRVAVTAEAPLPATAFGNMQAALPAASSNQTHNSAMRWIALAGGVAFVLVIMAFPAVMIALSEDARVQYLSLQKQNSWSSSRKDDAAAEPTKGRVSRPEDSASPPGRPVGIGLPAAATPDAGHRPAPRRSQRLRQQQPAPTEPSFGDGKGGQAPAGLHAMQCADESCESETSYMKHLFSSTRDPCSDFYEFVCSNWQAQNALPPNRRLWAVQDLLVQKIEGAVYWFLEDFARIYKDLMANKSLPTTKIFALLKACEDTDSIDMKGFGPLRNVFRHLYLDRWPLAAGSAPPPESGPEPDLEEITGMLVRDLAIHPFAHVSVSADATGAVTLQIDEPELSLTRHRYFDVSFDLAGYRQLVTDALNFVNERNDSLSLAAEIVDLEQQLAEGMDGTSGWLPESAQFEVVTLDELLTADNWSWAAFLSALFDDDHAVTGNATVIVKSPKFLEKLMKILETTTRHTLLNYLGYRVMCALAAFLPTRAQSLAKLQWERELGYSELPERWRVCLRSVDAVMALTMHSLHFEHYAKKNSLNFKNHFAKFTGVVSAFSSFFSDYAKSRIDDYAVCNYKLEKLHLESFAPNISKTLNIDMSFYDGVPFVEEGNALEGYYVARSHVSRALWDAALNGTDFGWKRSVFDLSCTYDSSKNIFELPLSLFHEPFFYNDDTLPFDDPRVTFRIGRELAKICPQNGIMYDSERDRAVWQEPPGGTNGTMSDDMRCLVEQYANFTVRELNLTLDGMSTLPENILDNMVLPPIYEAYREAHASSLKEHTIHHIDGTAFNQVFFLSFALGLCENMDKVALRDMVLEGRVSPGRFRVNAALMNFNKFGKIFGCAPGTPMNPLRKCTVWMRHE
ncbi:neprilysin-1-like [Amblyomma americanum]